MGSVEKARYILIGGFLGAGKTTSILKLAKHLKDQGKRVGLITNDQGVGLVDTTLAKSHNYPVEEIAGGCFCCKFNSLMEAAQKMKHTEKPDVFIAEPVGSCTDLVATVIAPLQEMYGSDYEIAPLSVVLDPMRALKIFGLEGKKRFSENVVYIYRKQIEEAQILIINKCELLSKERADLLKAKLEKEFPGTNILFCSAREGVGLPEWFNWIMDNAMTLPEMMDLDYERYGQGEAKLGWLNTTVHLHTDEEFDGNAFLMSLAQQVQKTLGENEVGHLKMTLSPEDDPWQVAAVNLVRGDALPEMSHKLEEVSEDAELILNLRAEADPDELELGVKKSLSLAVGEIDLLEFEIKHLEHFRPGKPNPVYRKKNSSENIQASKEEECS
ncbi:MAG: GTP-binding protein [Verrucomicrobiota bacterium]